MGIADILEGASLDPTKVRVKGVETEEESRIPMSRRAAEEGDPAAGGGFRMMMRMSMIRDDSGIAGELATMTMPVEDVWPDAADEVEDGVLAVEARAPVRLKNLEVEDGRAEIGVVMVREPRQPHLAAGAVQPLRLGRQGCPHVRAGDPGSKARAVVTPRQQPLGLVNPKTPSQEYPMTRRAFTLIEMLVVIGLVGLVVAILLPVLAGTRERAKQTQALANVRTVAQTFAAYTNTYGSHPSAPAGRPSTNSPRPRRRTSWSSGGGRKGRSSASAITSPSHGSGRVSSR